MHDSYVCHAWQCSGDLSGSALRNELLEVHREYYGVLRIEPGSAVCKADALSAALSLRPQGAGLLLEEIAENYLHAESGVRLRSRECQEFKAR